MGINVLSLFDGISCGMVALERVGIKVDSYVAYEIDKHAIQVSQKNYPQIKQCGDVKEADFTEYTDFDLLIGGSPCTYWSIARRPGLEHERETVSSGLGWELFMQYVRALKTVKPKYFLYENNESMSEAIKEEITRQLGVEPLMIDSADFSAQTRKRYYWTNIPVKMDYVPSKLLFKDIEYIGEHRVSNFEKYKDSLRVSKDQKCFSWDTSGKGNYSQQNRARVTEQKMNTLPSSGNDKNNIYLGGCNFRRIHPIEAERLQTLPDNYTDCLKSTVKRIEGCGNGWTVDVIAHIFNHLVLPE